MTWLLVGIGGALGSLARHGLNQLIHQRMMTTTFPLGIFGINVAGSVAAGAIAGILVSGRWHWAPETRTFVIVGLLGGFTTFSSFSLDTLTLWREGHAAWAALNVIGQIALSLLGVWAGFRLTQ